MTETAIPAHDVPTTRAAIYLRFGSADQINDRVDDQTKAIVLERVRRYIQQRGWHLDDDHVYIDDGCSGGTLNRPALNKLRDDASAHKLNVVVIMASDRLARNYVQRLALTNELIGNGCQIEVLAHGYERQTSILPVRTSGE